MDFFLPVRSKRERVLHPVYQQCGVDVWVQRDDRLHPEVSGNKWWKLKYNLQELKQRGNAGLLTFGGAWSNHIAATAAAGRIAGIQTHGIIRGEEPGTWSETLQKAKLDGMEFTFVSRGEYRLRGSSVYLEALRRKFPDWMIVPEGGANEAGIRGCEEILDRDSSDYEVVAVACGTGATMAGILRRVGGECRVIGFPAIRGGEGLIPSIAHWSGFPEDQVELCAEFHFGGYAKVKPELSAFKSEFESINKVQLDWVYTAKMVFGVTEMIRRGEIQAGARVLMIHTGGLQGNIGFLKYEQ